MAPVCGPCTRRGSLNLAARILHAELQSTTHSSPGSLGALAFGTRGAEGASYTFLKVLDRIQIFFVQYLLTCSARPKWIDRIDEPLKHLPTIVAPTGPIVLFFCLFLVRRLSFCRRPYMQGPRCLDATTFLFLAHGSTGIDVGRMHTGYHSASRAWPGTSSSQVLTEQDSRALHQCMLGRDAHYSSMQSACNSRRRPYSYVAHIRTYQVIKD